MPIRYKILGALWFYQIAFGMDRIAIAFAGPGILKSLSMGPQSLGVILSAFGFGYMFTQIPAGFIADRWRLKTLLFILPLLWSAFTGATALISTLAAFVVIRACLGVAEGMAVPGIFRAVAESFSAKERTRAMAISSTASAIGPAIAGPIIGLVMASYGWRCAFYVLAVPPLVAALLVALVLPTTIGRHDPIPFHAPDAEPAGSGGDLSRLMTHPALWVCVAVFFFFNVAYWGYQGWMPSYLASVRHIDLKHLGFVGGLPYVFAFVGLLTFGFLGTALDRWRSQLLAAAYALAGVSLYLAYGSMSVSRAVAGLCCAAFCLSGGIPLFASLLYEIAPRKRSASYAGIIFTAGQIGGFIAPFIIGALLQRTTSYASGFELMEGALIAAAAGMCLLPIFIKPRRGPGETQLSLAI